MLSDNFTEVTPSNYFNSALAEEEKRKLAQKNLLQNQTYNDPNYASDLSQQIVKNMDQELQYLKQLTSSNSRQTTNISLSNSPDSALLRKRRLETDPGFQNLGPYENFGKFYKPDPLSNINFFTNQCKTEGIGQSQTGLESKI